MIKCISWSVGPVNRFEIFFSGSENAIFSILLKYQEIDVQIQTFANQN